jgi:hypothetical protein
MHRRKSKKLNLGQVVIPAGHPNPPEQHEVDAAMVLARHYQAVVQFLIPNDGYKRKTPDIVMLGVEWEIKCPHGASKSTINNQLRWAAKQANNIVVDTRHTKLQDDEIEGKVRQEIHRKSSIRKVILINKLGKVVEIKM